MEGMLKQRIKMDGEIVHVKEVRDGNEKDRTTEDQGYKLEDVSEMKLDT